MNLELEVDPAHPGRRAAEPDIAAAGALLGDRARAEILQALCEREGLPASELARRAGVTAATASAHLSRLREAGWVAFEVRGRLRLYRIASRHVAALLEVAARIAPASGPRPAGGVSRAAAMRCARTCYDHLAGRLGVCVTSALLDRGVLEARRGAFFLVDPAHPLLAALGIRPPPVGQRPVVRACLDWSERRPHLAGALGAAVATRFLDAGWVVRARDSRAVRLTDRGRAVLREVLGVDPLRIEAPTPPVHLRAASVRR
jgi:DNA-binding transcriptional ArsR family regulator